MPEILTGAQLYCNKKTSFNFNYYFFIANRLKPTELPQMPLYI